MICILTKGHKEVLYKSCSGYTTLWDEKKERKMMEFLISSFAVGVWIERFDIQLKSGKAILQTFTATA